MDRGVQGLHGTSRICWVDVPSRRFFVHVLGGASAGGVRAIALAKALRAPGGAWRSFSVATPDGHHA
eukprot:8418301-Pyramimonas_sp.AAC.1